MDEVEINITEVFDQVTIIINEGGGSSRPTPGTFKVGTTSGAPTAGTLTWTRADFANNYVSFTLNGVLVYQNQIAGDGSPYLTKALLSDTLTIGNYTGGWTAGDILQIL